MTGRPRIRRRLERSSEHGQVLVLFVLFIVVLLGAAALTVDYGSWLSSRRSYQATADAAALAGAHYLVAPDSIACTSPAVCARTDSWKYLNSELKLGLQASDIASQAAASTPQAGVTVGPYTLWVDTPPSAAGTAYPGTLASNNRVMFVRVQATQTSYFSGIWSPTGPTVSAWATAGVFPNRFAVITLRRPTDNGPSNAKDITLAGNNTTLTVVNGDLGGNWGMKLNSNNFLQFETVPTTNYQPAPYLIDWTSCGNSCWSNSQVVDAGNNSLSTQFPPNGAIKLPGYVPDPNYAPPLDLVSNAPAAATTSIPTGDNGGTVTINSGTVVKASDGDPLTCDPTSSPHLGPGWYDTINVNNGSCLILDPLHHHSTPNNPATDIATPVLEGQLPGIYYVTCQFNISQGLVVGDGVTVIVRPSTSGGCNNQFKPAAGGIVDVNRGCVTQSNGTPSSGLPPSGNYCTGGQVLGAWTTKGASPYTWNGTAWAYQNTEESNIQTYGRGIAVYVLKPSQELGGSSAVDANTTVIQVNSGAGLAWNGVTYAPHDNATIAGQPDHTGVGQLISWTFTFNGGTNVTQYYSGPDAGFPILLEPCASGNGGAC